MGRVLFDDAGVCYVGAGVFAVWFIGGTGGCASLTHPTSAHRNPFVGRVSAAQPPFKSHRPYRRAGKHSAPAVNTSAEHRSCHRKP